MIYALIAIVLFQAFAIHQFHRGISHMTVLVADLLALTTAIKTQIDAIVVASPAEDLQPVADALTGIQTDLTTKFPPAA